MWLVNSLIRLIYVYCLLYMVYCLLFTTLYENGGGMSAGVLPHERFLGRGKW